jgi:hypothetical protein
MKRVSMSWKAVKDRIMRRAEGEKGVGIALRVELRAALRMAT